MKHKSVCMAIFLASFLFSAVLSHGQPEPGINLTGRWNANDGGTYYLRQIGGDLWWYGHSGDSGASWTNVFQGSILGRQITGRWADVPHGRVQSSGVMELTINSPNQLTATQRTGGFGGSVWTRQGAVVATPPPPAATARYLGCFKDQGDPTGTSGRDLSGAVRQDGRMTTQMCVEECRAKGFAYAGTQYSNWCFCGNRYGATGPADNCNMNCSGNPNEKCGGAWANSVYQVAGAAPPPAAGTIQVLAGTYGANCGQPRGNKTQHLAQACNGRGTCEYTINYQVIGDPAVGCAKDYTAEWQCSPGGGVQRATASPEAGFGKQLIPACKN